MIRFKVLSIKEWVLSHVFLVGGLVLFSLGLGLEVVGLTIAGVWVFAVGLCLGFGFAFAKIVSLLSK